MSDPIPRKHGDKLWFKPPHGCDMARVWIQVTLEAHGILVSPPQPHDCGLPGCMVWSGRDLCGVIRKGMPDCELYAECPEPPPPTPTVKKFDWTDSVEKQRAKSAWYNRMDDNEPSQTTEQTSSHNFSGASPEMTTTTNRKGNP